jgi:hypothetical protein
MTGGLGEMAGVGAVGLDEVTDAIIRESIAINGVARLRPRTPPPASPHDLSEISVTQLTNNHE